MYPFYRFFYNLVGFSRSQTNGFLLFLPLLILIIVTPSAYKAHIRANASTHTSDVKMLEELIAAWPGAIPQQNREISRRMFDPNIAAADELENIGLEPRIVRRILSYRSKGGKFRAPEDLLKIYGMDSSVFTAVQKYILIAEMDEAKTPHNLKRPATESRTFPKAAESKISDINVADTTALMEVFGVGSKLALRIIKYRDALGGFVDANQLFEVYRLDSVVVQRIQKRFTVPSAFIPKRLNLNSAGRQELATHPYIRDKVAAAIVAYRFQHGDFQNLQDLRKIPTIDSVVFRKMTPYLKLME